jgi:hypothetical protein
MSHVPTGAKISGDFIGIYCGWNRGAMEGAGGILTVGLSSI